jgi:DNA/RNA-binding domain of Phe-tRNA-synthetase-like protein
VTALTISDAFAAAFPETVVGALIVRGVRNPPHSVALETRKRELEAALRVSVGPPADVLDAYTAYYRTHGKTYHVKGQWESVARKGRAIPARAALVEAMFMAELEHLLLTAGHDLDALRLPLVADVTADGDRYVQITGQEVTLTGGDMAMLDGAGIRSTVLRGPDYDSRITPDTRAALFAVYAPPAVGEDRVRAHLQALQANVLLVTPDAQADPPEIVRANGRFG